MTTKKLKVGVLGATGMVGQRFVSLLADHPWFELAVVAASPSSAGKPYAEAVAGRWTLATEVPGAAAAMVVDDASAIGRIAEQVDFVCCAVDLPKDVTARLEEDYARAETPVVSNNSAHRWTPDVPVIVPELNADHAAVIEAQRRRLGTRRGFVTAKPNCSIQSYVPAIHPLRGFGPTKIAVCTYQALSGAGKTFASWPEMNDNVIPFIKGEEEKSEQEPLKIWGSVVDGRIANAAGPTIGAQCLRVPVADGHLAAVSVAFEHKPSREAILAAWRDFTGRPQALGLPSAPTPFLHYDEHDDRPQTRLDRDAGRGMAITIGRLRPDPLFDWRFVALSHNTVRGAAGGAVLTAELLTSDGYLAPR
ncbi:MAG TPA: aspartate-semialdehyde dehydrogenase [Kofleriaceae bacterium]|nr:aspartate-semialdehyde dehydrogenase [Kofleriaceae bacterium]